MKESSDIVIGENVELGEGVEIGKGCIIYSHVRIGDNTKIGSFCEIGHPTKMQMEGADFPHHSERTKKFLNEPETIIGKNSIIRSQTIIYNAVRIQDGFRTGHRALIREHTTMGRKCVVGTNGIIGGYCRIGDLTRVQTAAFVCQSVVLGRGIFVAPYVSFYDNKRIILGEHGLRAAEVGNYVRIGGASIILPQVKIGDNALIGAGSVVAEDVPENAVVMGDPAKIHAYQDPEEVQAYIKSVEGWK